MDWEDTVMKLKPCAKTKTQYPANEVAEAQVIIDQKQMEKQAEISFKAGEREMFNKLLRNPTEPKVFDWALDGNDTLLLYNHERLYFEGKKP